MSVFVNYIPIDLFRFSLIWSIAPTVTDANPSAASCPRFSDDWPVTVSANNENEKKMDICVLFYLKSCCG